MRDESRNQKEICYFCDGYVAYIVLIFIAAGMLEEADAINIEYELGSCKEV